MSATNYFLEHGYTPMNKVTVISGPNTIAVWTTTTGKRVFLTGLSISANQAGTICFYFSTDGAVGTADNRRFAAFNVSASATITPQIGCVESTLVSGRLFATTTGNSSDGWYVNMTGFEV